MAHRITLIITKESISIDSEIPHFYENGYLIIPFDDDGSEISQIEDLSKSYKSLKEIFDKYLDDFWDDGILGESAEIADYKSLLLVEFAIRLKLNDFLIYHYQEVDIKTYSHSVNFINRKVSGNGYEEFDKTSIDINNYWKYDSCQKKYINQMNNGAQLISDESIKTNKWYEFWKK